MNSQYLELDSIGFENEISENIKNGLPVRLYVGEMIVKPLSSELIEMFGPDGFVGFYIFMSGTDRRDFMLGDSFESEEEAKEFMEELKCQA